MSTPIERAAEAVSDALAPLLGQAPEGPDALDMRAARAALEAAIDEGELSNFLFTIFDMGTSQNALPEARAIKAHLLGGAE